MQEGHQPCKASAPLLSVHQMRAAESNGTESHNKPTTRGIPMLEIHKEQIFKLLKESLAIRIDKGGADYGTELKVELLLNGEVIVTDSVII